MSLPASDSVLALRRRSVWEAADSGILLWRESFLYFLPLFVLPVWITAFSLRFIPESFRWFSWIVLWWLKPFFDRFALHVVSSLFFRTPEQAGFRFVLRGLAGSVFRGLPGDLLWRRFSPFRSARMPLRVLERLRGGQFRDRKRSLATGGLNFCAFLTILGLVLEGGLLGGEAVFFTATAEIFFPDFSWSLWNRLLNAELYAYAAYCFNYILVESLCVCMGFGLYINSRVETEGWDLQILFRKFTCRPAAGAKALLLVFALLVSAAPLRAGEEELVREPKVFFPENFPDDIPQEKLNQILESADFGGAEEGWEIQLKNKKEKKPLPEINFAPWVERLREILALVLRALLVLAIAGFAVFTLIRLYRFRRSFRPGIKRGGRFYAVPPVSGSPEGLFEKAAEWYALGSVREAWAACLRGSIAAYARYGSLSFPPDATEYGCLELARARFGSEADGFGDLVRNWVLLAYGGRIPAPGSFERALEFGRSLKGVPVA
jgi:hypothetical protein